MQLARVQSPAGRQPGDRFQRQRPQAEPHDVRAGHIAEGDAQRVTRTDLVVTVGRDQQGARGGQPSGQEPQEVERGVICPVHVFDDEHPRTCAAAKLREQCAEDPLDRGCLP